MKSRFVLSILPTIFSVKQSKAKVCIVVLFINHCGQDGEGNRFVLCVTLKGELGIFYVQKHSRIADPSSFPLQISIKIYRLSCWH